ncbi:hypothetical protein LZ31DRAFT_553100 [Colletotrichum somersetense]|nr:hypothetical protein LZ31DRAFT_553100 [Colletotrichum somersetense]
MAFSALLRGSLWATLLTGVASQEQAPLDVEIPVPETQDMRLIACVKPSENSRLLEAEWKAAQSATEFPMSWIDDPADKLCADLSEHPSIRLLREGQLWVEYPGPRTSDEILRFLGRAERSSRGPVATLSAEDVDSFKNVDDFVCIGHLSDAAGRQAFEAVASKYWTEFTFGFVDSRDAAEVVCHKRDDESMHTRPADDGLEAWVVETSRPVIAELTRSNHQRLLDRGWPMVYIFSPSPQARASIRGDLHAFAKKQYSSLTAVTVDPTYFPELPAKLGLNPAEDGYPAGAVHQLSNGRVYPYPKGRSLTPRELQGWGLDVWQGRIRPWTPPGQEPENVGGGVRIAATRNLKVKNIPGLKIRVGGRDEL